MTRSATGGMIRHHPSRDLWEARYVAADGRRRSLYAKTRKDAQERLRAALVAADAGVRPVARSVTVAAYLESWLETSVRQRCRPRTFRSYSDTCRLYLIPALGRHAVTKLEPEHVARMLADLSARGTLSATTVRYSLTVLRIALARAVKTGRVARNAAALVDAPAAARSERAPLTVEQIGQLLGSLAGDRLEALYVLAVATGFRQGELLALRWSDIELETGTVSVRHTLEVGTKRLGEPKTQRSRRGMRVGPEAVSVLREHRVRPLQERLAAGRRWADEDFVFTTRHGGPLSASYVTHQYQGALARTGLPRQPFHGLRHAYATMQIEAGEDLSVVSRMLGHASITTTANVYAHLTAAMSERAAGRMDVIVRRSRESSATG